jgi:hypothetical protein
MRERRGFFGTLWVMARAVAAAFFLLSVLIF